MQILHCKIKERKKGKRKCTSGENTTLQNKKKETKGKENLHLVKILHCKIKEREKGNVHLVQIVHCKIKEGKGKENVHLVQILHCKIKERKKKMYIWCKFYIAK